MKVLLWIVIVLGVVLFFPVGLHVRYMDGVSLRLFVFLLPIKINLEKKQEDEKKPSKLKEFFAKFKKKTPEKPQDTEKPAEKVSAWSSLVGERGLSGAIGYLSELAGIAGGAFGGIMRTMAVARCNVYMRVGGDDAAAAAINYGRACAALYPLLAVVLNVFFYYRKKFDFAPDFLSDQTTIKADVLVLIFPAFVLWHGLKAVFRLIAGIVRERVRDNLTYQENSHTPHSDAGKER